MQYGFARSVTTIHRIRSEFAARKAKQAEQGLLALFMMRNRVPCAAFR
jgi:hypothetical protein